MTDASDPTDPLTWALEAATAADDKLGSETVIIDVGDVIGITGHFVITSGRNTRQVRAITDAIEERVADAGGPRPLTVEGRDEYRWVLMDYGDFVVHVFDADAREYYSLDRLWSDRPRVPLPTAIGGRTSDPGA